MVATDKEIASFRQSLEQRYKPQALQGLYNAYERVYGDIMDLQGVTSPEARELYVWGEILADAASLRNDYGTQASLYYNEAADVLGIGRDAAPDAAADYGLQLPGLEDGQNAAAYRDIRGSPAGRYSLGLTQKDISIIQGIGQKSVSVLSAKELQQLEPLARRYFQEMGIKSPFFRAWFGDWRVNDPTPITVTKRKGQTRGLKHNKDTGWSISISRKVFNETETHRSSANKAAVPYLDYLDGIIENAILLNSMGIRTGRAKSDNSLLMHSMYAVADIGSGPMVLRLYVEEMNDPGSRNTSKRAYQLQNIEKAFLASGKVQGLSPSFVTNTRNTVNTVADLVSAVKRFEGNSNKNEVSAVVNTDGTPKIVFHGTGRADRVGTVFRADRATSGPMAFFTDSREVAERYSKDKQDTSIAYDEEYGDYYKQFRVNRNGKSVAIGDLWNGMSYQRKQQIKEAGKHITWNEEMTEIVWDDTADKGLGNWDSYTLRNHQGNAIEALVDSWLESGELWGQENEFLKVLQLAGIEGVEYRNPDARDEKVYDVYLAIKNPFNTANVNAAFADAFERWYKQQDPEKYQADGNNADMWDKRNVTAESWMERLRDDIQGGTTRTWTTVPDYVTNYLKSLGYDGIQDQGGKYSGDDHTVWIPFYSTQIKSASENVGTFDPNNPDIRYSVAGQSGGAMNGSAQTPKEELRRVSLPEIGKGDSSAAPQKDRNGSAAVGGAIVPPSAGIIAPYGEDGSAAMEGGPSRAPAPTTGNGRAVDGGRAKEPQQGMLAPTILFQSKPYNSSSE